MKVRKFTYWFAEMKDDNVCYSIIAKTKKEARQQLAEHGDAAYHPLEKRTIPYTDNFDLFEIATGEGGGRGAGLDDAELAEHYPQLVPGAQHPVNAK